MPESRPPVLFLHGAGARGAQWSVWRRVFMAAGWSSVAPDREPAPGGLAQTGIEAHIAQSHSAFTALAEGRKPPLIVGASLGALLALAVAARSGAASAPPALILVNPLPPAPWSAALPPAVAAPGALRRWASAGRFASTDRALPGLSFDARHAAFHAWRDESARLLHEARAGLRLPAPSMPVLLIAGNADAEVPAALSAELAAAWGASLLRLPGAHLDAVMGAGAAAAAGLALGWLRAVLSPR